MSENIQIITIDAPNYRERVDSRKYYRLSLYEFSGDLLVAYFKEDLEFGSWDYNFIYHEAQRQAKLRRINFIPNISMGDSIEKVFKHILK